MSAAQQNPRGRGRALVLAAAALATGLLLAGCAGASTESLVAAAKTDFSGLVAQASAVDESVLHTLEVEKPVAESCDTKDSSKKHTVFVAAGTTAIQATSDDEQKLLSGFRFEKSSKNAEVRWTRLTRGVSSDERAYVNEAGTTAAVKLSDGLLVITVFSPCRSA